MNKTFLFLSILFLGLASCSSEDTCEDNLPTFEENFIGTWTYTDLIGGSGEITINEDGTYEEAAGEIISNGAIESRMWSIVDSDVKFDVGNAAATLSYSSYDCDTIVFVFGGFNLTFMRK